MTNHVQTVSGHVGAFVDELKNAIVTAMAAAAEGIRLEADVARVLNRVDAFHSVLQGIDTQKEAVLDACEKAESNAQRAILTYQLTLLDQQTLAVLKRSGVEEHVAIKAIETKVDPVADDQLTRKSSKNGSRRSRNGKGRLPSTPRA